MTVQDTAAPTLLEIADVLGKARSHIVCFGYCKKYLYNTQQARAGLRVDRCAVDLDGAIGVAVHGTPLHLGRDPLTRAAVEAVEAGMTAPSLAAWCDYKGNGKAQAIALLRDTEARLRRRPHDCVPVVAAGRLAAHTPHPPPPLPHPHERTPPRMTTEHEPEAWFWEAGSDDCPHGPEPKDKTSEEWGTWYDQHTPSPQDVRVCRDAPAGDACGACSEEYGEMVPWSSCRARKRSLRDGQSTPAPLTHTPVTVTGGDLECLEKECDDFFDEDGNEIPGKTACSHLSEMEICEACTGPWEKGEFPAVVAWADCPQRLVKMGAYSA